MRALAVLAALLASLLLPAHAQAPGRAALYMVFIVDGLRPDSITPQDTPNLHRLRSEGVTFANSHAVFPTVTRVNSAALATGNYPARNGLMGNTVFIPEVDPNRAFNTDDAKSLLKLGDHILTAPSLAEILKGAGQSFVGVSSGSTGSALLMAPRSPYGAGVVINGYFGEQASYPREAGDAIVKKLGAPSKKGGAKDPYDEALAWGMKALSDYVLPEMKPRVVFSWLTEPDHIQHAFGAGSPSAVESIRKADAQLGAVLARLESLGLRDRTDVMVVSDHGFAQTIHNVNAAQELQAAGLLVPGSDDVVLASSGQAVNVHVKGRDRARIAAIAAFLQRQPWCGLVFTAGGNAAAHEGSVAGTFSLEFVHLGGHERSPDIVFTFPWSSAPNKHGVRGTEYNQVSTGATEPVTTDTANHGGIGAWTIRNTMLAWGPDFKRGAVVRTPSSNVDVTPTLLHLLGITAELAQMQGRVLLEALAGGPDEEQVAMDTRTLQAGSGAYRALLQVSEVAGRRYVDKGWRVAAAPVAAAEVRVMISAGFYGVYEAMAPAFERVTGYKLVTTRGPSLGDSPESIPSRLTRGEAADAVILDGRAADELAKRGFVRAETKTDFARSLIGMVVRAGAPKPDISTLDAFRSALLAVKSIAYSDSSSGTYLSTVGFAKLGIADQVLGKARKIRGPPSGEPVAAVVARGEAEVGFQQVSELIHVPGIDFVGPIPGELQPGFVFSGALPTGSKNADGGAALLRFLSSPDAAATIVKAGLTPINK